MKFLRIYDSISIRLTSISLSFVKCIIKSVPLDLGKIERFFYSVYNHFNHFDVRYSLDISSCLCVFQICRLHVTSFFALAGC